MGTASYIADTGNSRLKTNNCAVLAVGVKYWNKQGGKCLCEEQDKERLFSFLGILGSE